MEYDMVREEGKDTISWPHLRRIKARIKKMVWMDNSCFVDNKSTHGTGEFKYNYGENNSRCHMNPYELREHLRKLKFWTI